jgi:alpha-D-ribose 1-methylphosphonate 5-triphosphate synthase subunit PhnH
MSPDALTGGFADAPREGARAFRAVLDALAHPGRIVALTGAQPPAPMSVAAGTMILVLCDPTTPLHLAGRHDTPDIRDWVTFHSGAPLVSAEKAAFALGDWEALQPIDRFAIGTPDYPDRSATLIVERPALVAEGARLTGPGIANRAALNLPPSEAFQANRALFPQGIDFFLTCGDRLAGLPRTTRVEAA